MWELRKGRNRFLDRHRFDHDHNVWWHLASGMDRWGKENDRSALDQFWQKHQSLLAWRPQASNCPAIDALLADVVDGLPVEWKALGRNIFVGVTLDADVNAEAWNHHDAGVIEISLQYLWALEAYASAFDQFMHSVRDEARRFVKTGEDQLQSATTTSSVTLRSVWSRLDLAVLDWRDPRFIAPGSDGLVRLPPGRTQEEFDRYQSAAQEFILCHEIAHHVLTHTATSARRRAREARSLVEPLINDVDPSVLSQLSKAAVDEIEADLVAFALMCGLFDRPVARADAYSAIAGAVLALVTATHVDDNWLVYDPNASHPPLVIRLWFIFTATQRWLGDLSRGDDGDHPLDYALQWRTFVECMMTHWVEQRDTRVADFNNAQSDAEYLEGVMLRYLAGWEQLQEHLEPIRGDRSEPAARPQTP